MPLIPGTRLGAYEILAPLGAGGMGEVYRARDTNLNRDVALKMLLDSVVNDPERVARFTREAHVLASLNHPHIAHLYGFEAGPPTAFLVMELVEGDDLSQRIAGGAIPLDEALPIAKQIAEALEAAHEHGIIHRDLKPANIKVRPDGTVKVLDFGLAKALDPTSSSGAEAMNSPTLTARATQMGLIIGTAAYMAPEQARGKTVDKRADIWSFGVVLFEMLTGTRAFPGEDVSDTLAAVLKTDPDFQALPPETPAAVRRLLRRCLKKDPRDRQRDIADLRLEIDDALAGETEPQPAGAPPVRGLRRPVSLRVALAVALGGVILASFTAGLALRILRPAGVPPVVSRMGISLPSGVALARASYSPLALSPDGTHLAYVGYAAGGVQQLYLRAMDSFESKALPGTEGATGPFFSPDGQWVGFFASSQIKKVAVSGGAPLKVCDSSWAEGGAAWGTNDAIVFSASSAGSLAQVPAAGGAPQELTKVQEGETAHRWPQVLRDGKAILFTILLTGGGSDDSSIAVQRLDTGERKILIRGGTFGRYVPTGHLVYCRAGTMMAVRFDAARLEVSGTPTTVLDGVRGGSFGEAHFSVSDRGSLAYVPGGALAVTPRTLVWVDRKGTAQPLPAPPRVYSMPRLSPDGRRVAVTINDGGKDDIWIYDLARDSLTRLTFEGINDFPVWTPEGTRVAYRSQRTGINLYWKVADGSGSEERLTTSGNQQTPFAFSPNGQTLVYNESNPRTNWDLWALPVQGERKPRVILQTPFDERIPMFSPDGRWLAYVSNESGRYEVYVQPFLGPGGKYQISTEGGSEIVWMQNGDLAYRTGASRERMIVVQTQTRPAFTAGKPRLLFEGPYTSNGPGTGTLGPSYSVSADGQRFLMLKGEEQPQADALTQINVVLNWFEELKQKVPTTK